MTVAQDRLVDAFSDCVGQEKAADVITGAANEMDLDGRTDYAQEEALEIAARVANRTDATPFVRTAAQTVQTRIRAGHL